MKQEARKALNFSRDYIEAQSLRRKCHLILDNQLFSFILVVFHLNSHWFIYSASVGPRNERCGLTGGRH